MTKRPKKGDLPKCLKADRVLSAKPESNITPIAVPEYLDFEAEDFKNTPLIYRNRAKVSRALFGGGRSLSTKRAAERRLRNIAKFIDQYAEKHRVMVFTADDVDPAFSADFIRYIEPHNERKPVISAFRRLLKCIGVPEMLWPTDPFQKKPAASSKNLLSKEQMKKAVWNAKHEARLVIQMQREADTAGPGHDPRRGQGRKGEWDDLGNRLWALRNIVGPTVRTWNEYNALFPGVVRQLERYPGALAVERNGEICRVRGIIAHLRYIYPEGRDIAPFVILTLIRTFFNFETVATLEVGKWFKPYPFSADDMGVDRACYIVGQKNRGKQDPRDPPKVVHAISLMKPWSHAYRILQTVEALTQPLRDEIEREICELLRIRRRSGQQKERLAYLQSIRERVFLYNSSITGISAISYEHGAPRWLNEALTCWGLPTEVRTFRDVGLAFGFTASGSNLAVLQILGSHSAQGVSALYTKRKQLEAAREEAAKSVFRASLELVDEDDFSLKSLARRLSAQGLRTRQIENVLDPDTTTQWGNRCADPASPPSGFSQRTPPGHECIGQRCIDGCLNARWFPESIPHVLTMLSLVQERRRNLGAEATLAGTFDSILTRLKNLLMMWPDRILRDYPAAIEALRNED